MSEREYEAHFFRRTKKKGLSLNFYPDVLHPDNYPISYHPCAVLPIGVVGNGTGGAVRKIVKTERWARNPLRILTFNRESGRGYPRAFITTDQFFIDGE